MCQLDEQKLYRVKVFFFMWSIFASDMCIQPLLSFLCFFKVYKRWTNLSIKLPAPSRDFHFLRSHVSSHSPIIFAKSCQKLHACNWLKTEFRHQNWTLFTSCYALPCDNELRWFLKEQWAFVCLFVCFKGRIEASRDFHFCALTSVLIRQLYLQKVARNCTHAIG